MIIYVAAYTWSWGYFFLKVALNYKYDVSVIPSFFFPLLFRASFMTENMNETLKLIIVSSLFLSFMKARCLYNFFL
jgi:RsiW-degrading membrane proteinase PrsW (M82 family)